MRSRPRAVEPRQSDPTTAAVDVTAASSSSGEVELEDVHAGLAQEPERPAVGVLLDEREDDLDVEIPRPATRGLESGVRHRDVGVDAGAGRVTASTGTGHVVGEAVLLR